jgi:hypothetical protein
MTKGLTAGQVRTVRNWERGAIRGTILRLLPIREEERKADWRTNVAETSIASGLSNSVRARDQGRDFSFVIGISHKLVTSISFTIVFSFRKLHDFMINQITPTSPRTSSTCHHLPRCRRFMASTTKIYAGHTEKNRTSRAAHHSAANYYTVLGEEDCYCSETESSREFSRHRVANLWNRVAKTFNLDTAPDREAESGCKSEFFPTLDSACSGFQTTRIISKEIDLYYNDTGSSPNVMVAGRNNMSFDFWACETAACSSAYQTSWVGGVNGDVGLKEGSIIRPVHVPDGDSFLPLSLSAFGTFASAWRWRRKGENTSPPVCIQTADDA